MAPAIASASSCFTPRYLAVLSIIVPFNEVHLRQVEIAHLVTPELLGGFSHGRASRWGLLLDVPIAAVLLCRRKPSNTQQVAHVVKACARRFNIPSAYLPFTLEFYREDPDPRKFLTGLSARCLAPACRQINRPPRGGPLLFCYSSCTAQVSQV